VIYVVDSNDRERIAEAKEELLSILSADELRGVPVLVLANKQDLPKAVKPGDLGEAMGMYQLTGRQWFLQPTCAMNGNGLSEGLDWMADAMRKGKGFVG